MQIYFADTKEGYAAWLTLWQRSPGREVYTHPGYATLWADEHIRPCAAMFETRCGIVFYPFLLRSLKHKRFWQPAFGEGYDIITPYGYGGPNVIMEAEGPRSNDKRKELYIEFYKAFAAWATEKGVVSEFVRFSLFNESWRHYYGKIDHHNNNVVVDLMQTPEILWKNFRPKVRRRVRLALKQGVQVFEDAGGNKLDDFLASYYQTMDRLKAAPFYYFKRAFFQHMQSHLSGMYQFFHAVKDKQYVATLLLLCSKKRVYSFLSGSNEDLFHMSGNDLLQYHSILWAQKMGYNTYVLGGGYTKDDGIFTFKHAFSPKGIMPFYIGKMIFDTERYQELSAGKLHVGDGFFPLYRF